MSSNHAPPDTYDSATAAAAVMPVSGSATASARKHGVSLVGQATSPPATAASSPNPARIAASPRRPWAVSDSQTLAGLAATTPSASMPSCASAHGREPSMTTSAASIRAASAAMPARSRRSRATHRLPALSRSKKPVWPRRKPSGRWLDSTFTTLAPAPARSCEQSGPAHSEERSATSGGRDRAAAERCDATTTGSAGTSASPRPETAMPSSAPRAVTSATLRSATPPATRSKSESAERPAKWSVGCSSHAETTSTSSGRGSATASHPSAAGSRRVDPLQLVVPWRRIPVSAARSPSSASGSTASSERGSPQRSAAELSRPHARCTCAATPSGAPRGGPSESPVSHAAPDADHAANGSADIDATLLPGSGRRDSGSACRPVRPVGIDLAERARSAYNHHDEL